MKEAILLTDGYKLDHRRQYPENTEDVNTKFCRECIRISFDSSNILFIN